MGRRLHRACCRRRSPPPPTSSPRRARTCSVSMDYPPTRWPQSPRIVVQYDTRIANGPNHLGLCARQGNASSSASAAGPAGTVKFVPAGGAVSGATTAESCAEGEDCGDRDCGGDTQSMMTDDESQWTDSPRGRINIGAGPHNMDYNPTRRPQSPRIVMRCAP